MVTLEDILNTYFGSDVCIGETLADIPADGLSLEDAHQLYMKTMNKVEEDVFFKLADGEIQVLTSDDEVHKKSALDELVKSISYIDVVFKYDDEIFVVRVVTELIDLDHYDNLWDWWCEVDNQTVKHPNLNVEVTGKKYENGDVSPDGIYVNVYLDSNDNEPKRAEVLKIISNL